MVNKRIKPIIIIALCLFLCAIMIFGSVISLVPNNTSVSIAKALAAEDSNDIDLGETDEDVVTTFAADTSADDILYLSDTSRIKHDASKSKSLGNTRLFMAPENVSKIPGGAMQAKIEGAWYNFQYGVYAHGASYVAFDISAYSQKYKYFSAYGGLLSSATKSDGALFYVQTSEDGSEWVTKPASDTTVEPDANGKQLVKYNQNFLYFTLDITGVKWIRLVADKNKSDSQDYVVWADAKLTTALDEGEAVKSLAAYDAEIKAKLANADFSDKQANLFADKSLELLVLQREFVSRVGQYALKRFIGESYDNKAVLKWLLNDLDSLREFMIGGAPFKGNYYNSLTVLSNLYKSYKKDLDDKTLLGYNKSGNIWFPDRTFGELCRTIMFSVALTHDGAIGSYLQGSKPENESEPNRRYAIFKYMYQTERFVALRNADGSWKSETMSWFESYRVEEMRWLMCNIIDDESIIWLNDYVQTRINKANSVGSLYTPHSYVRYTDPNYGNPVFYDPENHSYFNDLFAVDGRTVSINGKTVEDNYGKKIGMFDTKYTVPAGDGEEPYEMKISYSLKGEPNIQKVWMNFNNKFKTGSVCGGISKSGTNIRTSRGIPAHVIGQPGHAAILYYGKDAKGNGSWKIDNDVGGWLAATKGERHLLGWGNAAWQRNSGGTVVYFHLAQACLNDYDNYVKAEEYCWLAKVYKGELDKQEKLYEKALSTQILNLDAWYGLVSTYKANTAKTAANYSALAERIADTLWNHPVAMHCLFRLFTDTEKTNIPEVEAALTNPLFTTQLKTIEVNALAKAKSQGSSAAKSKVNYLLGNTDTSVADFSFDGDNAGCIVWSDTYSDGSFVWKYSLDGKKTWTEVTFNEGDSHAYPLPEKDLAAISPEHDIYVYIVGASPDNAYKIDVAAKPAMPDTLYANDWENKVIGVDGTYEWRYCKSEAKETGTGTEGTYTPVSNWRSYAESSPDCTGDKIIEVRLKGTAKKPASDSKIFTFTKEIDVGPEERRYISINYLSVVGFSTESQDAKRPNYAVNAIDGNVNTYWHTDYAKSIKATVKDGVPNSYEPAYIIIKLDVPRWISGLEFSQRQYNSNFSIFAKTVKVYVSQDGETWNKVPDAIRENLENVADLNAINFAQSVYGQYVKLEMAELYETNANDGVFTTVSLVNLYENTKKTQSPIGETMPNLSEIKPSKDIFADLGEIVREEDVAGEELIEDEEFEWVSPFVPKKTGVGLWIALSVIGIVLVAAAVVFVLYKRGIIKFNIKQNAVDNGSKPETGTVNSKSGAAKSTTNTAKSEANATKSKTNTAKTEVKAAKPKTDTTESKSSAAKPKNK